MDNEKLHKQFSEMSKKLKSTLADLSETIQITGLLAKDELDRHLMDAKGNLAAAKETVRLMAEQNEGRVNSGLIRMQMELDRAKAELKAKREARTQKEREEYVAYLKEHAEACRAMAVLLVEEANAAILEAQSLTSEQED